ncbi:failed axon connections homolog [Babylonia areolata]|uniref:failed axon connections homolog n=1 Tax=Babylonia areolata TaxID=304850 RepID=UPI003FD472B6
MLELLQQNGPLVFLTAAGVAFLFMLLRSKKARRTAPKDTVLIYGLDRGMAAPSTSPFPLKLETFCRMAGIPYMVNHGGIMSSKGKSPWMEYNGRAVADSQFCIEHLRAERGDLDPDAGLSPLQIAQARAFRELTEENLYWTMCYELFIRRVDQLNKALCFRGLKGLKLWLITRVLLPYVLRLEMWGHGIGRHSDAEIWSIAVKDLQALSDFLGEKKYFLGDEPRGVDCALFGMLCQILYHMPGSRHDMHVREYLPNIVAYVDRMKRRFWPDWNERCKGDNYCPDEYQLYPPRRSNGYHP